MSGSLFCQVLSFLVSSAVVGDGGSFERLVKTVLIWLNGREELKGTKNQRSKFSLCSTLRWVIISKFSKKNWNSN